MSHLFTLVLGIVLGLSIAIYLFPPDSDTQPGIATVVSDKITEAETRDQRQEIVPDLSPGTSAGPISEESEPAEGPNARPFVPANTPLEYDELIGPPVRSRGARELHATFKAEPRSDPWASAMEAGIAQTVSEHAPGIGLSIEYIECRTTMCELGGVASVEDVGNASALWSEVVQSGYWQGSTRYHMTVGTTAGITRFMVISYDGDI